MLIDHIISFHTLLLGRVCVCVCVCVSVCVWVWVYVNVIPEDVSSWINLIAFYYYTTTIRNHLTLIRVLTKMRTSNDFKILFHFYF